MWFACKCRAKYADSIYPGRWVFSMAGGIFALAGGFSPAGGILDAGWVKMLKSAM